MWDWNVEKDEVSYNDQWRISLGIDPRELLKRETLSDRLMLPSDDAALLERFERHFHGGAPCFQSEYRLATHDGTPKWFLAHARVVRRDAAGKALRVIGVLQDISRSKQDQRTALEVEQRWERAIRGTSDGLYEWDLLSGHVWYASRFRDIIGCAAPGESESARHSLSCRDSQRKHRLVPFARRGRARRGRPPGAARRLAQ
jgi:PAS domain S-box-containing protein